MAAQVATQRLNRVATPAYASWPIASAAGIRLRVGRGLDSDASRMAPRSRGRETRRGALPNDVRQEYNSTHAQLAAQDGGASRHRSAVDSLRVDSRLLGRCQETAAADRDTASCPHGNFPPGGWRLWRHHRRRRGLGNGGQLPVPHRPRYRQEHLGPVPFHRLPLGGRLRSRQPLGRRRLRDCPLRPGDGQSDRHDPDRLVQPLLRRRGPLDTRSCGDGPHRPPHDGRPHSAAAIREEAWVRGGRGRRLDIGRERAVSLGLSLTDLPGERPRRGTHPGRSQAGAVRACHDRRRGRMGLRRDSGCESQLPHQPDHDDGRPPFASRFGRAARHLRLGPDGGGARDALGDGHSQWCRRPPRADRYCQQPGVGASPCRRPGAQRHRSRGRHGLAGDRAGDSGTNGPCRLQAGDLSSAGTTRLGARVRDAFVVRISADGLAPDRMGDALDRESRGSRRGGPRSRGDDRRRAQLDRRNAPCGTRDARLGGRVVRPQPCTRLAHDRDDIVLDL